MEEKKEVEINKVSLNDKKDWQKPLLFVMVVILFSYIGWGMANEKVSEVVNEARFDGYSIAISELVDAAENENCNPFPVNFKDKKVTLINIDCLIQEQEE